MHTCQVLNTVNEVTVALWLDSSLSHAISVINNNRPPAVMMYEYAAPAAIDSSSHFGLTVACPMYSIF